MLQKVGINNFRCLREVLVPLRPLTVLIGPNDCGKSAFLAALQTLATGADFEPYDQWRRESEAPIKLHGVSGKVSIESISMPRKYHIEPNVPNPLKPVGFFLLPSSGIPMEGQGYADVGQPPAIGSNGEMIPALLDHLLRRDRNRFFAVVDTVRELLDGVEEVEIATPAPDRRGVELVIENGFRIPADKTSVGVRLVLFFVAMAYHPSPPNLILLEEPENGVHPKRLKDVVDLLREITQGKHGDHAAQVILTTHSPHLLDYVDLDQDQVLVFRRCDDGSRTAEPADAERLKTFLDEFMLGEVWYNEGEAGLVGRDP